MTNKEKVLELLKTGRTITGMDGLELGMISVRDYISMLRRDGHDIQSEWRYNANFTKKFKEYFLTKAA